MCREADILVAAAGQARMITADHVKPGRGGDRRRRLADRGGDRRRRRFDAVQAIAGAITPKPGGTGPMTIACLLENTLDAARMQDVFPA